MEPTNTTFPCSLLIMYTAQHLSIPHTTHHTLTIHHTPPHTTQMPLAPPLYQIKASQNPRCADRPLPTVAEESTQASNQSSQDMDIADSKVAAASQGLVHELPLRKRLGCATETRSAILNPSPGLAPSPSLVSVSALGPTVCTCGSASHSLLGEPSK